MTLDAGQYHRGLRDAEDRAQRFSRTVSSGTGAASDALGGLGRAFSSLASVGGGALGMISGAFSAVAGVAANLAGTALRTVADAFREVVQAGGAAAAVVGGTLAAAFVALGKTGIDMNLSIDGARAGLTALTGSAAAAEALVSKLRETAFSTQLGFKELLPLGTQLAGVYGPEGLGRVIPTIEAFDAAQKALSLNSDAVQRAMLGFRQMLSRGNLTGEELNQIQENLDGVDVRGILKRAFGTGDTELLADAGVTGRQVADVLVNSFLTQFGAAAKAAENRLPVLLSGFTDAFRELGGGATRTALGMLESGLKPILEAFKSLAANERFVSALAVPFELLAAAVQKVGEAAPAFTAWLGEVVTRENVIGILAQIGGGVKTITDEVGGFLSRVTGGAGFGSVWDAFGAAAKKALELVARAWGGVTGGIEYFAQNSDMFWNGIIAGIDRVKQAIEPLVGLVTVLAGSQLLGGGIGGGLNLAGGLMGGGGLGGGNPIGMALLAGLGIQTAQGLAAEKAENALGGGWVGKVFGDAIANFGGPSPVPNLVRNREGIFEGLKKQIPEALRGIGKSVLGTGADFAGSLIPPELKNFGSGLLSHMGQSGQAAVDRLFGGHAANVANAQKAITQALAPKAKGDELAPKMKLYGQGAGQGAGGIVPALPDKKALAQVLKAWDGYYDALREQVRLTVAQVSDEVKARVEMQELVPQLLSQMQTLVLPALQRSKQGTEEFYSAQREYFRLSTEIEELRAKAANEEDKEIRRQLDDRRKAAEEAQKRAQDQLREAGARTNFAEAMLQANPFLNDRQRMRGLVPALLQQFRAQLNPIAGESGNERFGRLTDAAGIIQKLNETFGLNRGVALAGGGMLNLGDRQGAGMVSQMLGQLDAAARQPLAPATVEPTGPRNLTVNFNPNIQAFDLRDPRLRQQLHRQFDEHLTELYNQGYPSPSY
ncbi:MAG: tape measure protein [Armatimonadota bacterium]